VAMFCLEAPNPFFARGKLLKCVLLHYGTRSLLCWPGLPVSPCPIGSQPKMTHCQYWEHQGFWNVIFRGGQLMIRMIPGLVETTAMETRSKKRGVKGTDSRLGIGGYRHAKSAYGIGTLCPSVTPKMRSLLLPHALPATHHELPNNCRIWAECNGCVAAGLCVCHSVVIILVVVNTYSALSLSLWRLSLSQSINQSMFVLHPGGSSDGSTGGTSALRQQLTFFGKLGLYFGVVRFAFVFMSGRDQTGTIEGSK
jgi:hypothetical protein